MITHRELLRFLIPHFVQRTKTGEFHAPTRSQLQRGSADPQLIPAKEAMVGPSSAWRRTKRSRTSPI